jgi:phage gp36-like protein
MMYCTNRHDHDLGEPKLIKITDRENTGVIDDAVLDTAITTAQAEINVWLEGRYSLPFLLSRRCYAIAMDMTRYFLSGDINGDHPVARRYAEQTKLLHAISQARHR